MAGVPYLFADINQQTPDTTSRFAFPQAVEMNGVIYFGRDDGHGNKLWKTDGTPDGATLVVDPGTASTVIHLYGVLGDNLYLSINRPDVGTELWKTDGTATGTVLVRDINSDPESSLPTYDDYVTKSSAVLNGVLYFRAALDYATVGDELWRTDGTEAGTYLLKDIAPGNASSGVADLVVFGDSILFTARTESFGRELWITDGTETGTVLLKDIKPGTYDGVHRTDQYFQTLLLEGPSFTALDGAIYFLADDGSHGRELWRTDGTTNGTHMVKDVVPGIDDGIGIPVINESVGLHLPQSIVISNDRLLFYSQGTSSLWSSDGTAEGTTRIQPNGVPLLAAEWLTPVDDQVIFLGPSSVAAGSLSLWRTDGTQQGTTEISSQFTFQSLEAEIRAYNGSVYFSQTVDDVFQLWRMDGTELSTQLVVEIPGADAAYVRTAGFGQAGPYLTFFADSNTRGIELWLSDGTATGTQPVASPLEGNQSSLEGELKFVEMGGWVYFAADDKIHGRELWRTDGTAAGTRLFKDFTPGLLSTNFSMQKSGELLYLSVVGSGLWRSDGTEEGTFQLAPYTSSLTALGSRYLFSTYQTSAGQELWVTDGTVAGTRKLASFLQFNATINVVGNIAFLLADDGVRGTELWRTDGTPAGTQLVKDIRVGSGSSGIVSRVAVQNILYFSADNGIHGTELWKTDGTSVGTQLVKDIRTGATSSAPRLLGAMGNILYFTANDGVHGDELWKTDGTSAGTQLVKDIRTGTSSVLINLLGGTGNILYFTANDGVHGTELWRSDGTSSGTYLLRDISAGSASTAIQDVRFWSGRILFAANDGVHGLEPWISDGTNAGTMMLADVVPGSGSGVAQGSLAAAHFINNRLVFLAAATGAKYWTTDGTPSGTLPLGNLSGTIRPLVALDDALLFYHSVPQEYGLWRTDGTPAGTYRLSPQPIAVVDTYPNDAVVFDNKAYFLASSGSYHALWATDGTVAGTRLVYDAAPQRSTIWYFTPTSSGLYMRMSDDLHGHELWRLIPESQNQAPVVAIAAPAVTVRQMPTTITLTASDEPDDVLFDWSIDWNGDGVVDQTVTGPSGMQVTHGFQTAGLHQVKITASDHLGAISSVVTANVDVRVWAVQGDPQVSGKTNLLYGGTSGDDVLVLFGTAGSALAYFITDFGNVQYLTGFNGDFIAYGGAGNDQILAQYASPVILYGGEGDDMLAGGSSNDLLDGGAGDDILLGWHGNDTLLGGDGRDLLLAGGGADLLDGGAGDDLLLSSYLLWGDVLSSFSPTALESIRAEWTSQRSYSERVANLSGNGTGSRNNGDFFLLPSLTTAVDTSVDELIGGDDDDWFLYANPSHSPSDELTDDEPGEFKTDLGALPG
jgi:ELWxxDGT repeat protein